MYKLSLKDRKMLFTLDINARLSLTALAKQLNISKQVAKYRLETLQAKGIIQGFYTDINPAAVRYSIFLVYFKFQNMTPIVEQKFIQHVANQHSVGVNATLNGEWEHCIGIWAHSAREFEQLYSMMIRNYEKYVKAKTVMIETSFYYFKPKPLLQEETNEIIQMNGDVEDSLIDAIDKTILTTLSKNCRATLIDLGKDTQLSPRAVKQRITNMERKNVILGYRVMINYQLLGFTHYRIFLRINNFTKENENQIITFLRYEKSVISVTRTIGFCELEFRAVVEDIEGFYILMQKLRNKFPDISDYEQIIYYKFHQTLNYFPTKD